MELGEAYSKMHVTEKEEESIKRYLGFNHTAINILADLKPQAYQELLEKKWKLLSEPAELKGLIEDFVNVYSVMCKNSQKYSGRQLVRGTSSQSVRDWKEEFNQIVSASTDESIAKRFMEAKDSALVHFQLNDGVPFLNAEDYREEGSASEKEIILAPFCKVEHKQEIASDSEKIRRYRIEIGAPNLKDIPPEELDEMMEEVTQGFAQNVQNMEKYEYLKGKIGRLNYRMMQATTEEKKEIKQQMDGIYDEIEKTGEKTTDFKQKLQTLLKGLCRQKQKEIELAKETIAKEDERRAREEEERKEEQKKKKLEKTKH